MTLFRRRPSTRSTEGGRHEHGLRVALSLLSGLMLGLSFPPFPLGVLAWFALVPLFVALRGVGGVMRGLRLAYPGIFLFHVITLNWTGGYEHGNDPYMMIAGAATMLVHPLFYAIPLGLALAVDRTFGRRASVATLPFVWVGFEYLHSLGEWSFPWLTLGNSQTYDLARIQFISFTGVYGLSFWVLCINAVAIALFDRLAERSITPLSRSAILRVAVIFVLAFAPALYGWGILADAADAPPAPDGERSLTVGIVQSNVDPWGKWERSPREAVELHLSMTRELLARPSPVRPQLVLWPETAVPFLVFTATQERDLAEMRAAINTMGVPVLTGIPMGVLYDDAHAAPPSAKTLPVSGRRYDTFNSAALVEPADTRLPWYGKMKMVPFAERVPYADALAFLDALRWGVGIGGWQIGRDSTIFEERLTGARFSTVICYESVYPGFVAAFVRKGAEFIALITIDSWWGHMSGAFQHERIAVLRAVENRRWIARCAVGGFSSFIDPYGRLHERTELFSRTVVAGTIERRKEMTFYTEQGDLLGEVCLWCAGVLAAAVAGRRFLVRQRTKVQS